MGGNLGSFIYENGFVGAYQSTGPDTKALEPIRARHGQRRSPEKSLAFPHQDVIHLF